VFALAVTAKGQVYAWGGNDRGELGNGTRKSSRVPVRVRLPAGAKVTAVAAGQDFAVARTSTGKLLAWGSDGSGQLGTGHKGGLSKVPVRVQLPRGTKVAGLFAGCAHALALTGAGSILSWGLNGDGQLGDGTSTDRARPVHVRLPAGTRATAISAGCDHSLARDSLGHVLAWGSGNGGELGNNGQEDRHLPVQVILPANTAAIAIGAGPAARSGLAIIVPAT
jgi:alpha-tubulin suppressor-like RCC1 family protein